MERKVISSVSHEEDTVDQRRVKKEQVNNVEEKDVSSEMYELHYIDAKRDTGKISTKITLNREKNEKDIDSRAFWHSFGKPEQRDFEIILKT